MKMQDLRTLRNGLRLMLNVIRPAKTRDTDFVSFADMHSEYKLYVLDCGRDVPELKPYGRTRFYYHPLQRGIQDTKCCGGLCTICTCWGAMVFINLEQLATETAMLLKPIKEFDLIVWKKSFKQSLCPGWHVPTQFTEKL